MTRRGLFAILPAVLLEGCAAWNPRPGPVRAMAPRPNPPTRGTAPEMVRQDGWVTRFWEELTPAQRRLVARRLRPGQGGRAKDTAEVEAAWDVMGLSDRKALVQGQARPQRAEVAPVSP